MVSYDEDANTPGRASRRRLSGIFSTEHKTIGLQYLWLSLASVLVGLGLSPVLRVSASGPTTAIPFLTGLEGPPERYAAIRLLHGSLMVFFVLTAAPQMGFGSFLLPLQIGAEEMAFPTLNLLSLWLTVASLAGITSSFFLSLSQGIYLWVVLVALFSVLVVVCVF